MVNETLDISIEYTGAIARRIGTEKEILEVNSEPSQAGETIKDYLKNNYGVEPPYIILVNSKSLVGMTKAGERLTGRDVLRVIPFVGGG